MSWFKQLSSSVSMAFEQTIAKLEEANPDIVYDNAILSLKKQHQKISTALAGILAQKEKTAGSVHSFGVDDTAAVGEAEALELQGRQLREQLQALKDKITSLKRERTEQAVRNLSEETAEHSMDTALANVRKHIAEIHQQSLLSTPEAMTVKETEVPTAEEKAPREELPSKKKKVRRSL